MRTSLKIKRHLGVIFIHINRPLLSCCEPHCESEANCKVFVMKINFHSYANKTNFDMKSFALSLAFMMRYKATRKWPIGSNVTEEGNRYC